MHFHAASGDYDWHPASTFPLGYMDQTQLAAATEIIMQPGDILGLISDGIYEYENASGEQFGQERLAEVVDAHGPGDMEGLVQKIMLATRGHGGPVPQADDITIVLVHRNA